MTVLRKTAKATDRVFVTGASLLLTLEGLDVPSIAFWEERGWWVVGAIGALVVFGVFTPVQWVTSRKARETRGNVRRLMVNTIGAIHKDTGIPVDDIGIHIWVPRRRWLFWSELRRAATMRVGPAVTNQSFRFTRGKGVVGLCWRDNAVVCKNVQGDLGTILTQADWDQIAKSHGGDFVMNMTFVEFRRVRHRGAVIAVPLRPGERFEGCVSGDSSTNFAAFQNAVPHLNELAIALSPINLDDAD